MTKRRQPGTALLLALAALIALPGGAFAQGEAREASLDVILLVDKSLSMVDAIGGVKKYLAGEVVGPLLLPGDRLIIEVFYGKIERLFAGTIRGEEDKAKAIRSLNGLVADGRFTDIGAVLDRAEADLAELGEAGRPKYVLLLTDERQEAPYGTKYYAPDYKLRHSALEYVRKVDLGPFRAITVGFGVGAKVEAAAPGVMKLLVELPRRDGADFPPLPPGSDGGLSGAAAADAARAASAGQGGAASSGQKGPGGASGADGARKSVPGGLLVPILAFFALAAALILALNLLKKRRTGEERHDH